METRPSPLDSWPTVSQAEARRTTRLLGKLPVIDRSAFDRAVKALLGTDADLERAAPYVIDSIKRTQMLTDPLVAVCLRWFAGRALVVSVVVEVPAEIAATVLDAVLGGDAGAPLASHAPPTGVERGILLYAAAQLANAALGADQEARAIVTTPESVQAFLGAGESLCLPFVARLGAARGVVHVWLSADLEHAPDRLVTEPETKVDPSLRVTAVVDIAATAVTASELRRAEAGDVVLLDQCWIRAAHETLTGEARFSLLGSTAASWRGAFRAGRLRLEEVMSDSTAETKPVVTSVDSGSTSALDGAQVEVAVEVARVTMSLGEVMSLGVGDVIETDRAVGRTVLLRAGGKPWARGELVDVDGVVGVRIVALEGR